MKCACHPETCGRAAQKTGRDPAWSAPGFLACSIILALFYRFISLPPAAAQVRHASDAAVWARTLDLAAAKAAALRSDASAFFICAAATAAACFGAWLSARGAARSTTAACLAAIIFAFSPAVNAALSSMHPAIAFFAAGLPFAVILLDRPEKRLGLRPGAAGAALAGCAALAILVVEAARARTGPAPGLAAAAHSGLGLFLGPWSMPPGNGENGFYSGAYLGKIAAFVLALGLAAPRAQWLGWKGFAAAGLAVFFAASGAGATTAAACAAIVTAFGAAMLAACVSAETLDRMECRPATRAMALAAACWCVAIDSWLAAETARAEQRHALVQGTRSGDKTRLTPATDGGTAAMVHAESRRY